MRGGKLDKVSATFSLLLFLRHFWFVSVVGRKVEKSSRKQLPKAETRGSFWQSREAGRAKLDFFATKIAGN